MSTERLVPLLELRDLTKSYAGVRALDGVALTVLPGEVHGLVGENGAGKSTLIKILAGATRADAGGISIRGVPVRLRSGSVARALGLAFIHQELNLVPYLSAAENIFLGRPYPTTRLGTVDWRELDRRATAILGQLGVAIPTSVPVSRLSHGEQTLVAISRAFAERAALIVMDEPTAALSAQEVERLFATIVALREQGVAVVYVSHRLDEIFALADRVTVMRNGRVVVTAPVQELDEARLIQHMIGQPLAEAFPPALGRPGAPVLKVEGLAGGPIHGASFSVAAGEVLGIGGLVGSGRTELLRLLFGADHRSAGTIVLDGRSLDLRSPADAIRAGLALVPEERRAQGLVLQRPISDNMFLPHLDIFAAGRLWLNRGRERQMGEAIGQSVRLRARGLEQPVAQLSGGNQQKVIFARWLLRPPRVLLLDEPTRGIDVGARLEIYRLIRELARDGMAIVMVSSDWHELIGMADRVLLLRRGELVAELPAAGLTQDVALSYCYGER